MNNNTVSENQQQVTYKVKYNEELRRFSLPISATWENVINKIGTLFSLDVDSIVAKYEDDEKEFVTIDSDAELQEAVRVFLNQSMESNLILRLVISDVPQKQVVARFAPPSSPSSSSSLQSPKFEQSSMCQWKRGSCGKGQERRCEWKEKREKFRAAMMQLEEKGFKCKGKNIRALKMCDYDVDKAVEQLTNTDKKCENFKSDLLKLQEMGFENKWTNCFVLKRTNCDIDKAVSILTQAKLLQEKGFDNMHFNVKLLVKYEGDVAKVEEFWNKKRQSYLEKRQKCMERKLKKCDWKMNKKWCKQQKWQQRKGCSKCGDKKMMNCEKEAC